MEIKKFKDGTYAVARHTGMPLEEFLDLREDGVFWWSWDTLNALRYCHGTYEEVKELYDRISDRGKEV